MPRPLLHWPAGLLALSLVAGCSENIHCQAPPLPSTGATAETLRAHKDAVVEYERCLKAKATASADEALIKADAAADATKRWIGSARQKLHD